MKARTHLIVPRAQGEALRTACGRTVLPTGSYVSDRRLIDTACGLCQLAIRHGWIEGYHYRVRKPRPTPKQAEIDFGAEARLTSIATVQAVGELVDRVLGAEGQV